MCVPCLWKTSFCGEIDDIHSRNIRVLVHIDVIVYNGTAFKHFENIPVAEFRKVEEAATDKQPAETETATDSTPTL